MQRETERERERGGRERGGGRERERTDHALAYLLFLFSFFFYGKDHIVTTGEGLYRSKIGFTHFSQLALSNINNCRLLDFLNPSQVN